jgi:hypothetical protein
VKEVADMIEHHQDDHKPAQQIDSVQAPDTRARRFDIFPGRSGAAGGRFGRRSRGGACPIMTAGHGNCPDTISTSELSLLDARDRRLPSGRLNDKRRAR